MKKQLHVLLLALLALLLVVGFTAPAAAAQQEQPVVRAVMFWMDTCPHCHYVMDNVLPPLEVRYGDQFDMLLLQISSQQEYEQFIRVAEATGLSRHNVGVPFLLIGDSVLLGSQQIETQLPELVSQHLAAGGVDFPQYDALAPLLPAEVSGSSTATEYGATPVNASAVDGYYLAMALMIGMILSLLYAGLALAGALPPPPSILTRLIPLLALAGLFVAGYLAYVETQAVEAFCGPVGDCNAVQTSSYAYLFGVPLGVIGAGGYVVILGLWTWMRRGASIAAPLLLGASAIGLLFSLYLTYLEPFVIRAVCAWCLASAAIMTLLMVASVRPVFEQRAPAKRRRASSHKAVAGR
ncbi:MAG TPA: vitamin K epoxide reductase family protein [Candidatus Sulfomarinibacteraceae bacterium]|nr:vitamin K epoxide reductase family protein [Candidatus Sulfomarinibacteraceae bacterium]